MKRRDEFTARTKRELQIRASFICSNPDCWSFTINPGEGDESSISTGEAGHINGASPDGPRYDVGQTPLQRKSISNGIWLCRGCHTVIDGRRSKYAADMLRAWKAEHEGVVRSLASKGYSESIEILRLSRKNPDVVRQFLDLLSDKRALYTTMPEERPPRVLVSLDALRAELIRLRRNLTPQSTLYKQLSMASNTILSFYKSMEKYDLLNLQCDSSDERWRHFVIALQTLRKALYRQVIILSVAYDIPIPEALESMVKWRTG